MASRVVGGVDGTRKGNRFDFVIIAVTHTPVNRKPLSDGGRSISVVAETRSSLVRTISFTHLPMWSVCGFGAD